MAKERVDVQQVVGEKYEIKPYVPLKDKAFSEEGDLPPEDFEAFSEGFEDGLEEEDVPEIPEPEAGTVATIINLDGELSFVDMDVPEEYDETMDVEDYLEKYFGEDGPIEIGSEVVIAIAAVDDAGKDMNLPEHMVVVTGVEVSPIDARQDDEPWYVFLLKDNLDIYQTQNMDYSGMFTVINFDGVYPTDMKLGDDTTTRSVDEYVKDHISNGWVPYGFDIGFEGYIRPCPLLAGTVQFYNSDRKSVTGRPDWYINLLPSNVVATGEMSYEDEEKESRIRREPGGVERDTGIHRGRIIKDQTLRIGLWVNPRNGKTKESGEAPGSVWLFAPIVTTSDGILLEGTLQSVIDRCIQDGTQFSQVDSKAGYPIEVMITSNRDKWVQNLKSLGGNRPITYSRESDGTLVLKYR